MESQKKLFLRAMRLETKRPHLLPLLLSMGLTRSLAVSCLLSRE